MYQFKDCSPVQIRWIHIYLYILRQFNESNSKIKLDEISLENLKIASRDLSVKKKALKLIEKKRANKVILKSDYIFLDLLMKSPKKKFSKLEILKSKHGFEKVIDNDFIDGICEFLFSMTEGLNSKFDTDLLNLRDEMLAAINKLKYLLTLK